MIEDIDELDDFAENEENGDEGQNFEHYRFVADPGQRLLRVDVFLTNRIENASRNKIQEAAQAGCIHVNGKPVKSNYRVKPNDVISVVFSYPPRK